MIFACFVYFFSYLINNSYYYRRITAMFSSRSQSEHRLKHELHNSLRKQRELSNRITVLMIEKQRRLKQMQNRMNQLHDLQGIKMEKAVYKEQMQRTFHQSQQLQQLNSSLSRNLKNQLALGRTGRQAALLQTKKKWYRQIKKMSQTNRDKISQLKSKQVESNKNSSRRIKLMEIHCKQNVKQYWKERVECIHKDRQKETQKASQLFENSVHNISVLEQKQQKLLKQIKQTVNQGQYYSHIIGQQNQGEPYNLQNHSFS